MIWFACKQCGKKQQRPEEAAGTLVFCTCGEGNRVPWESTVAPDEVPPPTLERSSRNRPFEDLDEPRPRSRWSRRTARRRDPAYCFNHEDRPSVITCADCGEAFCASCVVTLQEKTLCGPCKNFRLRTLQRSAPLSGWAVASLVVALFGTPIAGCLTLGFSGGSSGQPAGTAAALIVSLITVCAPVLAAILGLRALRDTESGRRVGGRSLAITGLTTAAAGILWCLTVALLLAGRQLIR